MKCPVTGEPTCNCEREQLREQIMNAHAELSPKGAADTAQWQAANKDHIDCMTRLLPGDYTPDQFSTAHALCVNMELQFYPDAA
jgi:hypothetical protein